ncbi:MAG: MBL fold metallo-hydrolase [Candidatus Erginobacter occultus]|nr:MBL fold metallo-hydrolase [Candidatus Erginobacter occultus]
MKAHSWQPVPGAPGAEIYPWLRKPHVLSSNSFVIRGPEAVAVIDPGGLPEQTAALAVLVREELARKPRPVYILLTHCHLDHCRQALVPGFWQELPGRKVVIHTRGARALKEADRRLTQEEILGGGLEPFAADITLFADPGGEAAEFIPLGGGAVIEARPAPGHSPDGVCYRLGEAIFVGDLLSAVTPLIAGAPGWHREELIASLRAILEAEEIRVCYPGHGRPLLGDEIPAAFRRALAEAEALEGIGTFDLAGVKQVSGRARELFRELGAAFSLIRERLERLAGRLDYLEEWSAGRDIRAVLDSQEVKRLLDAFREFLERFKSRRPIETEVALKGVQLVGRIADLLDYQDFSEVLDPALLRLTRGLLDDYLAQARGFRSEGESEKVDLEELVRTLAREMTPGTQSGPALEDIPDDPEGFRRYLIGALARGPWSRGLQVRVNPSPNPVRLAAGRERIRDTILLLLQELSQAGADKIEIGFGPVGTRLRSTLESGSGIK